MNFPKTPKDPLDAVIVAFLWAEWFVKQCFIVPYTWYEKWDQEQFNKSLSVEANPEATNSEFDAKTIIKND